MAKKGYSLGSLADYVDTKVSKSGDTMTGGLNVPLLGVGDKALLGTGETDVFLHNKNSNKYLHLWDDGALRYSDLDLACLHSGYKIGNGLNTIPKFQITQDSAGQIPLLELHVPGTVATGIALHPESGNFEFWNTNGSGGWNMTYGYWEHQTGTFYAGSNGNFNDVFIRSDERLKSDKTPLVGALDKVCTLQGYTYTKHKSLSDDTVMGREAGILAQDLEKVLPEATHTAEDTQMTISNSGVNALLIEAVKELRAEVMELRTLLEGK